MSISLTEKAAQHVQEFLHKRGKGLGIKIGVKTTGCSGLAYIFEVVDSVSETDIVYFSNGVNIFVDPASIPFISGSEIQYEVQGLVSGFKVVNPQAESECGCGESFKV